jgi:two-component system OmpR family response regulator
MLPGEVGLTLCRELRSRSDSIPVIILTAKGDEIDRVVGLETGADDYVAKPFSGRELVARIRAVLRRTSSQADRAAAPEKFCFGNWALDTARHELERDNDILVPLSTGEYNLLLAFVKHAQRVLTRDQLLDLGKGRVAGPLDRSIDLQVSRLRRKIGDDARNPQVIKTVRGGGYIFTLPVTTQ